VRARVDVREVEPRFLEVLCEAHVAKCPKFLTAFRPAGRKCFADASEYDILSNRVKLKVASCGKEREFVFDLLSKVGTAASEKCAEPSIEAELLAMRADEVEDRAYGLAGGLSESAAQLL
jgi:hypothetical protein